MSCFTSKTFKTNLVLLSWGMVMAFSLPSSAQTETQLDLRSESGSNHQSVQVVFEPPTDDKADDSRGGASRNATGCRNDRVSELPLTALIPGNNRGLTVASHPSFFVYVPQTSARQIYFSLKDENNVGIYQAKLPISGNSGVVKISLPPDQTPLETGKTYDWSVALMCQPAQPDMPWVTGQVQRVPLEENITPDLSSNPSIQQAVFYGQAGIWYDTLNILFQLNQSAGLGNTSTIDVSFLNQNWVNLLNSVGLNAIADEPLIIDN